MAVIYWQVDWIEFSWVLLLRNKHKRKKDSHEGMPLQLSDQLIQMRFQNWAFTFWYMQLCDAMMLPFNLLFLLLFKIAKMWRRDFRCYLRLAYGITKLHILDCERSLLCGICINSLILSELVSGKTLNLGKKTNTWPLGETRTFGARCAPYRNNSKDKTWATIGTFVWKYRIRSGS